MTSSALLGLCIVKLTLISRIVHDGKLTDSFRSITNPVRFDSGSPYSQDTEIRMMTDPMRTIISERDLKRSRVHRAEGKEEESVQCVCVTSARP
jgi:hypothetical protein